MQIISNFIRGHWALHSIGWAKHSNSRFFRVFLRFFSFLFFESACMHLSTYKQNCAVNWPLECFPHRLSFLFLSFISLKNKIWPREIKKERDWNVYKTHGKHFETKIYNYWYRLTRKIFQLINMYESQLDSYSECLLCALTEMLDALISTSVIGLLCVY